MKNIKYLGPLAVEQDVIDVEHFINTQSIYGLDLETNVTDEVRLRRIHTIQVGNNEIQYVINVYDFAELFGSDRLLSIMKTIASPKSMKLIHYAQFEITTFLNYNVRIQNVYDTMLIEYILTSANFEDVQGYYSLESLGGRYLCREFNKELQKSFGLRRELTQAQIEYAATDVEVMLPIYRMQVDLLKSRDDEWVVALENETVRAYSDIHYEGMLLDQHKWLANLDIAEPLVKQAVIDMENILRSDPRAVQYCTEMGYYYPTGVHTINWASPPQAKVLLSKFFSIEGSSKALVKGYVKKNFMELDLPTLEMLTKFYEGDKGPITEYLVNNYTKELTELNMFIPEDTFTINWNSPTQRLDIFRLYHKDLAGTGEEDLASIKNPTEIIKTYDNYRDKIKLVTSYGQKFIDKHVQSDGRIRTTIHQIVRTGRVSSRNPNMQQIPANDDVKNIYRNAFIANYKDWVYVDSDYSSQELCVIAYFSGDPVWKEALSKGQDLHSVCAELVFKEKWKAAAEDDCAYYTHNKSKCNCKKHKPLRSAVKSINFGLAYGMSAFKLSWTMGTSILEAEALIQEYFATFPAIGTLLDNLGRFGVRNGFITTAAPFFRKRYFSDHSKVEPYKVKLFLRDGKKNYHPRLGEIERASKNTPIQGSSADMAKFSLILIMWYIEDNNLFDKVKLVAQVHDQDTTQAHKDYAEEWKPIMTRLMEEAALLIIKDGSLKSETNITDYWTK